MPTLFISYKRNTAAVAPLMAKLREAHYRLWFDRDEIHLGDSDWQARIDQGIRACDAVILNITPAACASEPVRYEVRKAREMGKPIFPIVLEKISDYDAAIRDLGLADKQHIENFTDVTRWDEQIKRLLRDLEAQRLRVTRHDLRQERDRNNPNYVLHQHYLCRLVERIGTLNLAQINPDNAAGVVLEQVYVDSPTGLSLSVEVQNWQVVDWWLSSGKDAERSRLDPESSESERRTIRQRPKDWGYEHAPFEALIGGIDSRIEQYRQENPEAKPDAESTWENRWNNGEHRNVVNLHLNHLAAACDRLVILGAPGSGKSTFVKYLALCLAGEQLDGWTRPARLATLDNWPHGALTPVYIELRRFVASAHFPPIGTLPTADDLWDYIRHDLLGADLADYAPDLQYDLENGHAVIILDGLDEVPYPEGKLKERQAQIISLVQGLNARFAGSRVLVASRPYAYDGWTLLGFEAVTITEFEDSHRTALAQRLYQSAGFDQESAHEKAEALNRQLAEKQIDAELKDRPLFVTLMATIYLKGEKEGLPTRRGALYRESILLLLNRWTQSKTGAPSLIEILGDKSLDDLYARLAALAYDVHEHDGDQRGTPEIDESLLYKHLKPLGRGVAAELIPYLSENAGVLVSPGQDDDKDVFHFAHRTFQEYLAAAHLVTLCADDDSFERVRDHIIGRPQVWRMPCTLVGGVLADTDRRSDLWNLIGDLLPEDAPDVLTADDNRCWAVWLAAVIVNEQKPHEGAKLKRGEQAVRDNLIDWLVKLVETAGALEPPERAAVGRALGLLGDPRPGVGVIEGLPDIEWLLVPSGAFLMGTNKETDPQAVERETPQCEVILQDYYISRYPITNVQFQAFVDAEDGYDCREWWTDDGWEITRKLSVPNSNPDFLLANHPVIGVSWYKAVAFCQWLSAKFGYEVRLPTESEWEKAARGTDGRIFPYGNEFDATRSNTVEMGIGQTSAVGIFPADRSPYGISDTGGNSWDWCSTKLRSYTQPEDNGFEGKERRIVRGGSFAYTWGFARVVTRHDFDPRTSIDDFGIGFRVVCHSPSLSR